MTIGDAEVLVRQSREKVSLFDQRRITEALIRETGLAPEEAERIALEVKEQIERLGITTLTAPLIRGLVNARLISAGLLAEYRAHSRLGVPVYDVARIIQSVHEDGAFLHGPEGTSLALAEAIKREYAMLSVFSEAIAFAHLDGGLHIENLGEIDRPQGMIGAIDFIKRNGVRLPGGFAGSRPARRPEVLASHLVTYTAALQGYFSGALTWDSLNYAFAPMLVGLNHREIRQLAQGLLFELSAPTIARGGQPIRCDIHLDWDAPPYIRNTPMLGAGGEPLSTTYGTIGETARNFLQTLFEVYLEGDAEGFSFAGLRPIIHLRQSFLENPGNQRFLELLIRVMTERGGVVLSFDRQGSEDGDQGAGAAFTSRYGLRPEKLQRAGENWQWRAAVFSSVSINLPRLAYRAEGDRSQIMTLLTGLLELAAQASLEKRIFLEKLLARGEAGSLALLAMRPDKEPFLPLSWTSHAINIIGLAEMAQFVTGEPLADSTAAMDLAREVIDHLHQEVERLSALHKVRFLIAESRDSTARHRLAAQDVRIYGIETVNRSIANRPPFRDESEACYTNSAKPPFASEIEAAERIRLEGSLQRGSIWNAAVEIPLGIRIPSIEQTSRLISQSFHQTQAQAITLSPEFTICSSCQTVTRGTSQSCPQCGSARVDGLASSQGRYSRTSTWDRWRLEELLTRWREN